MGVLRVKVDGVWVDVNSVASSGVTDEVAVGPDDPGEGIELWYDTDDEVAPFPSTWAEPGILARPVGGAPVDSAWGQWAHDGILANTITNYVGYNQIGSPVNGTLAIDAGSISLYTGASGQLDNLPFKVAFAEPPIVTVCSGADNTFVTVAIVEPITTLNFTCVFRNVNGGAPIPNHPVRVNYIAVGRPV